MQQDRTTEGEVDVALAGELHPLRLGPLHIWPPVVLAPMAGVTNYPYRDLCRRFGAGLCVGEMVMARALVLGSAKTIRLARFGPDERPRSLQLYGVDPHHVGEAVARLVGQGQVDHIDMNFGCPVRKVTRKGGGAALPLKPRLLAAIVRAAVRRADRVPVTLKFRMGIDEEHLTYLETGRVAREEGCSAVTLHARTAAQLYDGQARWEAIAELKDALPHMPVMGNGDVWQAHDALRMVRLTGCDAVVVGRGCLGRPWLFRDLANAFDGRPAEAPPTLGEVVDVMSEHARALSSWLGAGAGLRSFRRHATWYSKGFPGGAALRRRLMHVETLAELDLALAEVDRALPFPVSVLRTPRGKASGRQKVALPEGYLANPDDATPPGPGARASGG